VNEREWTRLLEQLRRGDCTPFLGAGASSSTLPLAAKLSEEWAERYDYPFADRSDLAEVTQYAAVIEEEAVIVKQRVADELAGLGLPDFTSPIQPHVVLARQPITVFVTTNYDDFMTKALLQVRKQPVTAVCPWYRGADDDEATWFPEGYEPTVDEPLVYHLHGSFEHPPSMVLTQEDYLEFLITLAKDRGMGNNRVVPTQVLPAMTRKPLLFLGYGLRDWSFRTLFQGLHSTLSEVQRRRHISIQLAPVRDGDRTTRQRAEDYLRNYYAQQRISVHWNTVDQFCAELTHRLGSA
jgi:hypothetical protein